MRNWSVFVPLALCGAVLGASTLTWSGDLDLPSSWAASRIPKWTHGALMVVQFHDSTSPLVWIAEPKRTYSIPFSIPGATATYVYDWDRSADGTAVALTGSAMDKDGRGAYFIAQIPVNGGEPLIIRDPAYRPRRIVFAADGTLWTAGSEPRTAANAGIFRHFDRTGKQLGAFVPQGRFADPLVPTDMMSRLMAASDRIGWYSPRGSSYIELAADGRILTDIALAPPADDSGGYGMTLTRTGTLFISSERRTVTASGQSPVYTWEISSLNRTTNAWNPVLQRTRQEHEPWLSSPAQFAHVLGMESGPTGDQLVLSGRDKAMFFSLAP